LAENREALELKQTIQTLESQRSVLGDTVTDISLGALYEKLKTVEAADAVEQLRKYVTVLFADVSGFTSICRTNDAENITEAINTLWNALDTVIIGNGGTIDKHIGDCVMAVWGLSGVREDDPLRAVQAALCMQNAAGGISSGSDGLIPPFRIRVGVHSGPVFVSHVGLGGEYTVMGDTVNVASRLQSHAPLGSVLVSGSTWKHVMGDFSFKKQPPVKARGIDEELDAYLVTAPAARRFSWLNTSVIGIETAMVGRAKELESLSVMYEKAVSRRVPAMVTITGEAGIGKSRLLHEFRLLMEKDRSGVFFFNARCTPGMADVPCSVFRDILRFGFDVQEDDCRAEALKKLERGLGRVLNVREIHCACHFAGFDTASSEYVQNQNEDSSVATEGKAALLKYFREISASERTIIYLEDLHWADLVSLELVEQILREIQSGKLFVLCLARPSLLERIPGWGNCIPNTFIQLEPLSPTESLHLVNSILHRVDELPSLLTELITDGADGNPFYVEELIKMLAEDGVISTDNWSVNSEALTGEKVPSTLTGVLQSRLDALPRSERVLLQMASVVGRVFWDMTVEDLCRGTDSPDVTELLSAMEHHDLIHRMKTSTFSNSGEYLFKHAILRDVTYETVLLRMRKDYHRLVASWLEKNGGERVAEFAGLIAHHCEKGEDWKSAVKWLARSGKAAMGTSAYREALSMFQRALAAPPAELDEETAAQLHLDRGACLEKLCRYSEAEKELNTALAMSKRCDCPGIAAESLLGLTWIAIVTGDRKKARELAGEACVHAIASGSPAIAARAHMRMADFVPDPTYEKVLPYYRKAHEMYLQAGSTPGEAITLLNMGNAATAYDRLDEAEEFYRQSLLLYEKTRSRWGIANCLGNLGCVNLKRKNYGKACDLFRKSLAESIGIGDLEGEAICGLNLGEAALAMNEPENALVYLRDSLAVSHGAGLLPLALASLKLLAGAHCALGSTQNAVLICSVLANSETVSEEHREWAGSALEETEKTLSSVEHESIAHRASSMKLEELISWQLLQK